MARSFLTAVENLIGLWEFNSNDPAADMGLSDGIAQTGDFDANATVANGALVTDGDGDAFTVDTAGSSDNAFDLSAGTIVAQFNQSTHIGTSPDTIVNRGEYDDRATEGFFEISVTEDGRVAVDHEDGAAKISLKTAAGFFAPGDDVRVTYSWDAATGVIFEVENLTDGTEVQLTDATENLTMAIGDNDDESFTIAAGEASDGVTDQFFAGTIDYVAIYDVANPPEPEVELIDPITTLVDADIIAEYLFTENNLSDPIASRTYTDTATDFDGVAQTGTNLGSANTLDGALDLDGTNDAVLIAADENFQIGQGAVSLTFNQAAHVGQSPDTLISRDSGNFDDGGHLTINVTSSGNLVVRHQTDSQNFFYETGSGFFATGDDVRVFYQWDDQGEDGRLIVQNLTDNTEYSEDITDALTLDMGPNFNEPWTIGASQIYSGDNGADNLGEYFDGAIDDVRIWSTAAPALDGMVTGTAGDDVIDTDYADDPEGDVVDGQDAIDPNASPNDDVISALGGDDTVDAGAGDDSVSGGEGDDTIDGGDGDDVLSGDAGDDTLVGGAGNDTLDCGADRDTIIAGPGDVVDGGEAGDDNDTLDVRDAGPAIVTYDPNNPEAGTVTFVATGGVVTGTLTFTNIETVLFTPAPDGTVSGTSGDDLIDADYADDSNGDLIDANDGVAGTTGDQDVVEAGAGNDVILSGEAEDTVFAGSGDDLALGQAGDDVLLGEQGSDILSGGAGADDLQGAEGDDQLSGGAGDDTLNGGDGLDLVTGGDGDDIIDGGDGDDILVGDAGDDQITGGAGNDDIQGGAGDDTLIGGAGADEIRTGEGSDTVNAGDDRDIIFGSAGDVIDGGAGGDDVDILRVEGPARVAYTNDDPTTESGTVEFLDANGGVTGTLSFTEIESVEIGNAGGLNGLVEGTDGNDTIDINYTTDPQGDQVDADDGIFGTTGDQDVILGFGGDDQVVAGDEEDTVYGGAGGDELYAQSGDDEVYGGGGDDTIYGDDGNDFVVGDGPNTIGGDYNTTGDDFIDGGAGDDTVVGSGGADDISGGDGNDLIFGGFGGGAYGTGDNLILNASFDGDAVLGGSVFDVQQTDFGAIGDGTVGVWTTENGERFVLQNNGAGGIEASSGVTWLNLDGVDGNIRIGHFVQGVVAGESYEFSFDAANALGQSESVNVYFGGELIDTITPDEGAMQSYQFTLTGGSGDGSNRLEFEGLGVENNIGVALDNIAVFGATTDEGDTIVGGAGDDTIYGEFGDDLIDGNSGSDTLFGGSGDDRLDGGKDNDTLYGGDGDDALTGGAGDDLLDAGDGDDFVSGGTGNDTLLGGAGDDGLIAGDGDNLIIGGDGHDYIEARDGSDSIVGGDGDDTIVAGNGNDMIEGGDGDDRIRVGNGVDTAFGGAGNDFISGSAEADQIFGGADRDTFVGGGEGSLFDGGEAGDDFDTLRITPDSVVTYDETDPTFDPATGISESGTVILNFRLPSGELVNGGTVTFRNIERIEVVDDVRDGIVFGDTGGVASADLIDTNYVGDNDGDVIDDFDALGASLPDGRPTFGDDDLVIAGDLDDTVFAALGDDVVLGEDGNDTLNLEQGNDDGIGGQGDDTISGGLGDDTISGDEGDDVLRGDEGADIITGGLGDDTIFGGIGTDSIEGNEGEDVIFGGFGDDTIDGGADHDAIDGGLGVDTLRGGTGNDDIFGGADNDAIFGDEGEDTLRGGSGDDTLDGGADNDTLEGGDGNDTLLGNTGDDHLVGGSGSDVLEGGDGDDDIHGGSGDDSLIGGEGDDALFGGLGDDFIDTGAGTNTVDGGRGDNTILSGEGNDVLIGQDEDDTFTSLGGNNTIVGNGGNDTITTGSGDDVIFGGAQIDADGQGAIGSGRVLDSVSFTGSDLRAGSDTSGGGNAAAGDTIEYNIGATQTGEPIFARLTLVETTNAGLDVQLNDGAGGIALNGGADTSLAGESATFRIEFFNAISGAAVALDSSLNFTGLGGGEALGISLGSITGWTTESATTLNVTQAEGQMSAVGGAAAGSSADDISVSFDDRTGFNFTLTSGAAQSGFGFGPIAFVDGQLDCPEDGNDVLNSGAGNDMVFGAGGVDIVDGGAGTDQLSGGKGNDIVDGGEGDDILSGDEGDDSITGGVGNDTILGGTGTDTLDGGDDDDLIDGGSGNDSILGGAGNDTVIGGLGADTLNGGEGDDIVLGGAVGAVDIDPATASPDVLFGGSGNDTLDGKDSDDSLFGGTGDDVLFGGNGDDYLEGNEGNDTLYGDTTLDEFNNGATAPGEDVGLIGVLDNSFGGLVPGSIFAPGAGSANNFDLQAGQGWVLADVATLADGSEVFARVTITELGAGISGLTFQNGGNFNGFQSRDRLSWDEITDLSDADIKLRVEFIDDVGNPIALTGQISTGLLTNNGSTSIDPAISFSSSQFDSYVDGGVADTVTSEGVTFFGSLNQQGTGSVQFTDRTFYDVEISPRVAQAPGVRDSYTFGDTLPSGVPVVFEGSDDTLLGGAGDDVIFGEDGDDTIEGGEGADTISGGAGDDTISGGFGEDVITLDGGADVAAGGTDSDRFIVASAEVGELGVVTVEGGEDDDNADIDVLDLAGLPAGTVTAINFTAGNAATESGTVFFSNGSSLNFSEIEQILTDQSIVVNDLIELAEGLPADGSTLVTADGDLVEVDEPVTFNNTINGQILTGSTATIDGTAYTVSAIQQVQGSQVLTEPSGGGAVQTVNGINFQSITLTDDDGNTLDYIIPFDGTDLPAISEITLGTSVANPNAVVIGDIVNDDDDVGLLTVAPDGTVSGTAGDDVIVENSPFSGELPYRGDPEGDQVDSNDAVLGNVGSNDDIIDAGAGDDTIRSGEGSDTIFGGEGDDVIDAGIGDDTASGGAGDDTFRGGAGDDAFFGGDGDDRFTLNVGGILADGDTDVIDGGADGETDGDIITVTDGGAGETLSVIFDGDESGQISSTVGTSTTNFTEIEGISASGSNVVIDASQSDVDQNLEVSALVGATVTGGSGNDTIRTIGETTVDGGQGDDVIDGFALDTVIQLTDDFGDDTIDGGEVAETAGDTLDASGITAGGVTVNLTADEDGTLTDNTTGDVATFVNIENIITTDQDDVVDGSATAGTVNDAGNPTTTGINVDVGEGADTVISGLANDTFNLGVGDGDNDVVVLQDNFREDTIIGFETPTVNPDGSLTSNDTFDVTGLTNADGDPVTTDDVVVTDTNGDGTGDAILTFPNGESVTLTGVTPDLVDDVDELIAIGIPPAPDGTVSGTDGNDVIAESFIFPNQGEVPYRGDPDGDQVDSNDAIIGNVGSNDDIIEAGAGNDFIRSGFGNDTAFGEEGNDFFLHSSGLDIYFGGAGNDTVQNSGTSGPANGLVFYGGEGADTNVGNSANNTDDSLFGEAGNDVLGGAGGDDYVDGGAGDDFLNFGYFPSSINNSSHTYVGGESDENTGDTLALSAFTSLLANPINIDVIFDGDEAGTVVSSAGTTTIDFSEIENVLIASGTVVTIDASASSVDQSLTTGVSVSGSSIVLGGGGNDTIATSNVSDLVNGGLGNDAISTADGDDLIQLSDDFGNDTITGGEAGETNGDTLDASGLTTSGVNVDFSASEAGTVTDDTTGDVATFFEIENIITTDQDDVIDASAAIVGINVDAGDGADTITGGDGDDTIELGAADEDNDVVVLTDDFGDDVLSGFETPTVNPDGSLTSNDTFDVTGLTNTDGDPVTTDDVVVTDTNGDGTGDAILTFPNGESVTLTGVTPDLVDDVDELIAIGIPPVPDGTVSGTDGDDVIIAGQVSVGGNVFGTYTGDPDGDLVDNNDAVVGNVGSNDDIIEAGAGDDYIDAGVGDDTIEAGAGDDEVRSGEGDDIAFGEAGNDLFFHQGGDDTYFGGDGDDAIFDVSSDGTYVFFGGAGSDRNGLLIGDSTSDTFFGEAGDDFLNTTGGSDVLDGGDGNDSFLIADASLFGAIGSHVITGGEGAEIPSAVAGEIGGDTLSLSRFNDPSKGVTFIFDGDKQGAFTTSNGDNNATFSEIEVIDAEASGGVTIDASASEADQGLRAVVSDATITGGSGDDSIETGDGVDVVDGGAGADLIETGFEDDLISLSDDFGNDRITGGEARQTNGDTLDASGLTTSGVNVDFSASEAGTVTDDTTGDVATFFEIENIITTDQDDVIDASAVTSGGVNAEAGGGDDTLIGGGGADTLSGGDDADTFSGLSDGDVITGGEGGTDVDTIKVGPDTPFNVLYDAADPTFDPATGESESGVIQLLDAPGGSVTGTITFSEIENIMCFTPGTLVATAQGQKPVETLNQDDLILTRDNGFQPIAWTGQRALTAQELAASPKIQPILIKANSLGEGVPERDMMVSPNHRMLVTDPKLQMYLHESEALVAAKHMTAIDGVAQMATSSLTYVHFMFERHEVVLADGAWSESFQPGDYSMNGMPSEQRAEIDMLFPELEVAGAAAFMSARTQLKGFEARTLFGARKA